MRNIAHQELASIFDSDAEQRYKQAKGMNLLSIYLRKPDRRSSQAYKSTYEDALKGVEKDDISIEMTRITVRRFHQAGIKTIVYVTPINIEDMAKAGGFSLSGLRHSFTRLGEAVCDEGGVFADFHDILRDNQFRDAAGHLTFNGKSNGYDVLVNHLAPLMIKQMKPAIGNTR